MTLCHYVERRWELDKPKLCRLRSAIPALVALVCFYVAQMTRSPAGNDGVSALLKDSAYESNEPGWRVKRFAPITQRNPGNDMLPLFLSSSQD